MSYLRTLQADVQTGMQSVRSDLQSLSDRLQKVEALRESLKVRLLPLLHVQLRELQRTSYLLSPLPPVRGQTGSSKRRTTTPSSTRWISTSNLAMMPKASEFSLSRKRQSPSSARLCPRPYLVRSGGNCGSVLGSQTSPRQRLPSWTMSCVH